MSKAGISRSLVTPTSARHAADGLASAVERVVSNAVVSPAASDSRDPDLLRHRSAAIASRDVRVDVNRQRDRFTDRGVRQTAIELSTQ